jgi:hypothetical protein
MLQEYSKREEIGTGEIAADYMRRGRFHGSYWRWDEDALHRVTGQNCNSTAVALFPVLASVKALSLIAYR